MCSEKPPAPVLLGTTLLFFNKYQIIIAKSQWRTLISFFLVSLEMALKYSTV